jgi:hypothetical protein
MMPVKTPAKRKSVAKARPQKSKKVAAPKLTSEQQGRLDSLRAFFAEQQRRWDALSPEEQREEHEGWKRAMNNMNEDRRKSGQRLLFLDEIE